MPLRVTMPAAASFHHRGSIAHQDDEDDESHQHLREDHSAAQRSAGYHDDDRQVQYYIWGSMWLSSMTTFYQGSENIQLSHMIVSNSSLYKECNL
jgi:hypothetical protein